MEDRSNNGFDLPKDYFNDLEVKLRSKMDWHNEHLSYSFLKNKIDAGFRVPDNYFDLSADVVRYPGISGIDSSRIFNVPSSYFQQSETLLNDELKKINIPGKETIFSVPDNYFADTAEILNNKLQGSSKPEARILPIKALYFAAAATFIVVLSIWLYRMIDTTSPEADRDCGTLACIDERDLLRSRSIELLTEDELTDIVDFTRLEQNISEGAVRQTNSDSAGNRRDFNDDDI